MRASLSLLFVLSALLVRTQVLPNYALFDAKGRTISSRKMIRTVSDADVIFFGELHNNAVAHWLQQVVALELAVKGPLVMGAEMIEADDQAALDRYLRGEIDQAAFDTLAQLWKNHPGDYAPLVNLARERKLTFVATNVPRRFARAVSRGGFEALDTVPEADRAWIAPLPMSYDASLPQYVNMLTMMGDHGSPNMVKAQALKDATMAHFIARHARTDGRFLHFNGSYHSDFHEGICWYLQRARPDLDQVTITTVTQLDLKHLATEHLGKADIIIVVDERVPGTY